MTLRIGINGFGRIGRAVARIIAERDDISLVAINNISGIETSAHLLRFDSVHGRFGGEVEVDGDKLVINGEAARVTSGASPEEIPWGDVGVDLVLECSGRFVTREAAAGHLKTGAPRVLVSAPAKGADATIVVGVNDDDLDPENHKVISSASCTTNCLAPMAKVLHEAVGIKKGLMTTIHAYTSDQRLLDASHRDLRRARAAALSMVPTTTGAAAAVSQVLPVLKGRLDGMAIRVPTPNVSMTDLTFEAERDTSVEEIHAAMKAASEGPLKGILAYETAPVVSIDLNGHPASVIYDAGLTRVIEGNLIKVMGWYDNEWGFSNRMIDLAKHFCTGSR